MSILIDSGVFVAFHNRKDVNHDRARELMKRIASGKLGTAFTSDYIFDEAVTVALARTGRSDLALSMGRMILGELTQPFLVFLRVGEDIFRDAWNLFSKYARKGLSFTDCTSLSLMKMRGIESIASYDSGFDGLAPRTS